MPPTNPSPGDEHPPDVSIRPLVDGDLTFVAGLQARALPHGFFHQLGEGFLRRYLATYASSDAAVALVAERGDARMGFLVGTLDPSAHRQEVLRGHGRRLAASGSLALVRRPRVAAGFLRTRAVRYAAGAARSLRAQGADTAPAAGPASRPTAVLNHVAVIPEARGLDAGTRLVEEFLGRVRAAGLDAARLVTLAGPDGAAGFYDRLGWHAAGGYVDGDGVAWTRYEVQTS